MVATELDTKSRLAQLPNDVLPTMHFVGQLPGMEKREVEDGYEKERYWFGSMNWNGQEGVIGIKSIGEENHFLIGTPAGAELWELRERQCNEIELRRKEARYKPLLVPDSKMDRTGDDSFFPKFIASVNFCSNDEGQYPHCSDCVLKNGLNSDQKPDRIGRNFDITGRDPIDFPLRRRSDVRIGKTIYTDRYEGIFDGFESPEKVLGLLDELKQRILSAEHITPEKAIELLPGEVFQIAGEFKHILPREQRVS